MEDLAGIDDCWQKQNPWFIYLIVLSIQEWDNIHDFPAPLKNKIQKKKKENKQSPYAYFCLWPEWWQAWFLLALCQCIARGCPRVSEAAYPLAICVDCSLEMHRHWCLLSFLPRHPWATYPHKHRHLKPTIWPRLEDHTVAASNGLPLSPFPVTQPSPLMLSAQVAMPYSFSTGETSLTEIHIIKLSAIKTRSD